VAWLSSGPKRSGDRTRWTDIDRIGAGKVRGRQKRTKRRHQDGSGGGGGDDGGSGGGEWLNPGLFARSKWRSAVILKFSRWQGARIGLKNQSGSLFLMITASRPESGNCWCCCCFLPISPPCPSPLHLYLSVSSIRVPSLFSISFLGSQHQRFHSLYSFSYGPPSPSRSLLAPC